MLVVCKLQKKVEKEVFLVVDEKVGEERQNAMMASDKFYILTRKTIAIGILAFIRLDIASAH